MNAKYIVAGIAMIAIAIALAILVIPIVSPTEQPTAVPSPLPAVIPEPTQAFTGYLPNDGTEKFVFGDDKGWEYRGNISSDAEVGSLWEGINGRWVVITMRGQVVMSGSGQTPEVE